MTVYYVTVNQPGYMPESDPIGCETLDDARACLESEIWRTADAAHLEVPSDDELTRALQASRGAEPNQTIAFAGYAHTITVDHSEAF